MGKYILLQEGVGKEHIPHMLGRVVVDKEYPVREFVPHTFDAPESTNGTSPDRDNGQEPFHPDTVIPNIADHKIQYKNFEEVQTNAKKGGANLKVTKILDGNIGRNSTNSTERSARRAVRYQMVNHSHMFDRLMRNARYKAQVEKLQEKYPEKQLSFVTSILTAQDLTWNESKDKQGSFSLGALLPLDWLFGGAGGGIGDVEAKIDYTTSENKKVKAAVDDEIIIALAYDDSFVDNYLKKERRRKLHLHKQQLLLEIELPFSGGEFDSQFAEKSEPPSAIPSEMASQQSDGDFSVEELREDDVDASMTEQTAPGFHSLQMSA